MFIDFRYVHLHFIRGVEINNGTLASCKRCTVSIFLKSTNQERYAIFSFLWVAVGARLLIYVLKEIANGSQKLVAKVLRKLLVLRALVKIKIVIMLKSLIVYISFLLTFHGWFRSTYPFWHNIDRFFFYFAHL